MKRALLAVPVVVATIVLWAGQPPRHGEVVRIANTDYLVLSVAELAKRTGTTPESWATQPHKLERMHGSYHRSLYTPSEGYTAEGFVYVPMAGGKLCREGRETTDYGSLRVTVDGTVVYDQTPDQAAPCRAWGRW